MVGVWERKSGQIRNKYNDIEVKKMLKQYGYSENYFKYIDNIKDIIKSVYKEANSIDYDWFSGNNCAKEIKDKRHKKEFILPNGEKKNIIVQNKDFQKKTLLLFKKIFDENNLVFYLDGGTLLGAVREQNFINYDFDIDIVIFIEDLKILEKIVPILIKHNYILRSYSGFLEFKFVGENDYIDVRFRPKTRFTKKLDNISFLGTTFKIPKNIDEYLTKMYGNWKIPSFKHSWAFPQ